MYFASDTGYNKNETEPSMATTAGQTNFFASSNVNSNMWVKITSVTSTQVIF